MSTLTTPSETALMATVTTKSGSTYRINGDRVVREGPAGEPTRVFTLVTLRGGRLIYTDGQTVYRSSRVARLSTV